MAQCEKAAAAEKSAPEQQDSLKYGIFLLEKKLRNLDKKKGKVENLMKDKSMGKELNEDQQQAVNRFDEINHNISLVKDLKKQFDDVLMEVAKQQKKQKKQAFKDMLVAAEEQMMRIRDVMRYKTVLDAIADSTLLRTKVSELVSKETLDALLQLSKSVQIHFQEGIDDLALEASKILFQIVEGKNKPAVNGLTYAELKASLQTILEANLWNEARMTLAEPAENVSVEVPMKLTISENLPTNLMSDTLYEKIQGMTLSSSRSVHPAKTPESEMIFTTINSKHVDINDFMNGPVQFMSTENTAPKYFNVEKNSNQRNANAEEPNVDITTGMTYTNRNFPTMYNDNNFGSFNNSFDISTQVEPPRNIGKHNLWASANSVPLRRQTPMNESYVSRDESNRSQFSRTQNVSDEVCKGHHQQRPGYNS